MRPVDYLGFAWTAAQCLVLAGVFLAGCYEHADGDAWISIVGGVMMIASLLPAILGFRDLGPTKNCSSARGMPTMLVRLAQPGAFCLAGEPEPAGGVPCSVRASSRFGFASRSPYGRFLLRASSIFPLSPPIGFTRRPWCWAVLWPASLRRAAEPWPSRCSASSSRWSDFSLSLVVLNIGQLVYFNLQNPSWEKITASTIFSVILMAAFAVTLDRLALARDKRAS